MRNVRHQGKWIVVSRRILSFAKNGLMRLAKNRLLRLAKNELVRMLDPERMDYIVSQYQMSK